MHHRQNNMEPRPKPPFQIDISPKLSPAEIKEILCVIGSILYFSQAIDITVFMALSSIAIKQSKGTTNTMEKVKQLLDCLATYPDMTICFWALDMILNVHSDASFLSESEAHSCAYGHFFMGGPQMTATPSFSMAHYSRYAPSYILLSLPQPKQN